ncbi:Peptidoglycan-binding domain 1 protein [Streptomyces venezuelae]|uniref:hypothetical protein n=1 Tax=Streptomyces gardneri TaxID=66892 RepID=UPI0006BDBF5D|nr:hypothetical protein [Streptomyces gardneri]ALO10551.1 Peptidoglycan-binding domain 1 protein [Streptomyces venezuelae]QPK47542.1 peptidoglycan-binding protein [Streptomyces gardneri]WRK38980.1 peptidoglycan-binding protein [Streptomyces venezuelae]CUM38980.1 Peptidoglycan-binding domain 1 protein [Streptomyces venezuelae]
MVSALTRRRRTAISVAVAAALLSTGGVIGSMSIKSPAQALADSGPPKASLITAPVVERRMIKSIVFRGDFGTGRQTEITPTGAVAADGESGEGEGGGAGRLVVTKVLVNPGAKVGAARPLVEVSGRPVFALPGPLPSYRDLLPGRRGEDIAQLQDALAGLDLSRGGDPEGYFGAGTQGAVERLYRRMGYAAPVTGARTEDAVTQARTALEEKQRQVDELVKGRTERPTPRPTADEGGVRGAGGAGSAEGAGSTGSAGTVDTAGSAGTSGTSGTSGPATSSDTADALRRARKELAAARVAYGEAVARDGVMIPMSEMVFAARLPARVTSLPLAVGDAVEGPVAVLTSGGPRLTGYLDPTLKGRVTSGTRVEITSEALGTTATGTVGSVGAQVTPGDAKSRTKESGGAAGQARQDDAGTVNGGVPFLPVSVVPDKPWSEQLAGQNVMIKISSALTDGKVLAVPQAAMLTGADARTTVTVLAADGAERRVVVIAGVSADGMVQITPGDGDGERIAAGDRVVIGQ